MSSSRGWNPFTAAGGSASGHYVAGPFTRLARTHALAIAGDALIALSLADSVFFSNPGDGARTSVGLYLLLTMAPFAFVAPLIGPALDRAKGGRRWAVVIGNVLRMMVALVMTGHLASPLFYPEAFFLLVLAKGYSVAKSAIVPSTVTTDTELVEANSKLSILTGLSGLAAGIPGAIALWIGGTTWTLVLAALAFGASALAAMKLPNDAIAEEPADEVEREELQNLLIRLSASAMGLMRGVVGFLAFLFAFAASDGDVPTWYLGLAIGGSVAGSFVGSAVAPRVRATTQEEDMFVGSFGIAALFGLISAWTGGLAGVVLAAFSIGFAANTAKLAFDSLVQRDAPDANRGRSFARFETRFQLAWVVGALIPVVLPIPLRLGYLIIFGIMVFAVISYVLGRKQAKSGRPTTSTRRSPRSTAPGPKRKPRTNTRGRTERPPTDPPPRSTRPKPPRLPGPAKRPRDNP